ncbi:NAD(P)-dependent alcohol dehydrogenase [Microbacterium sp. MYb62]|uniref:NAD(P)-dependent alcohol dehydrogenase n=1 Tax=Microbacterium sp. MYb62 TaxID=1848690 RepID=UPI000CFD2DBF|nr:NAD(P)-dependent alcohol dehydrogenase [Microbacterium sp. MYb62]PRB17191.1 NAD(P)-dependent alcohol dehydrogenase [Microbacterium sp. MYb62]
MKRTELPTTMRASVLVRAGELTVETRAVPVPSTDQVIVRVNAVGICGSDVHYFHEGRIGDFVVAEPLVLGHEAGGVIVAVGADVDDSRLGERVSIEPQRPCRVCEFCRSGRYNLCPRIEFYATPPIDGAFAEYVAIQDDFAYAVPDSVSDDAAALMEPLSVAIAAVQKADVRPGSRVLITGAGPIGIVTAQTARAFGATEIVISDPMAERREVALRFGATEAVDPAAGPLGSGYDAFVDASGSPVAVKQGISALKSGGVAVLVGMGADEIALPVSTIQNRELIVTGIFRYANTWPTAIDLVASGAVDLDALVTGAFGLAEVREALDSASRPSTLKSIVRPDREYARES